VGLTAKFCERLAHIFEVGGRCIYRRGCTHSYLPIYIAYLDRTELIHLYMYLIWYNIMCIHRKIIIGDGFSFSFIVCSFLHQYYNLYVSKRPTHILRMCELYKHKRCYTSESTDVRRVPQIHFTKSLFWIITVWMYLVSMIII